MAQFSIAGLFKSGLATLGIVVLSMHAGNASGAAVQIREAEPDVSAVECSSEDGSESCSCRQKCCRGQKWCKCDEDCD